MTSTIHRLHVVHTCTHLMDITKSYADGKRKVRHHCLTVNQCVYRHEREHKPCQNAAVPTASSSCVCKPCATDLGSSRWILRRKAKDCCNTT